MAVINALEASMLSPSIEPGYEKRINIPVNSSFMVMA
jgi:hypothetical protein